MFRRQLLMLLLPALFCILPVSASRQNVLAHALLPLSSPHDIPGDLAVSASIQAPNNIWYAGNRINSSDSLLVRHWNGKTFDSPLRNAISSQVFDVGQAVLSLSPTQTWVVANGLTNQNPLRIIYLHGSAQTIYPSPSIHGEVVNAMAAITPNDIWAVGSSGPLTDTFTMHWNGKNWQRIASPNIAHKYSSLWGVCAYAADDVWAVGSQQGTNGGDLPLIMHWNSKAWTITPTPPLPALPAHALNAVTIVSHNDVWATGLGGLIEHWNGTQWQIVSSPLAQPNFLSLNSISAFAPNNIWAVGAITSCPSGSDCITRTYAEHWNGQAWRTTASPSLNMTSPITDSLLFGVHMFATDNVWTIGRTDDQIFLAHWNGKIWQITTSHNIYS
jgi:hypothetical protein